MIKTFKTNPSHSTLRVQIKKNEMRGACNMEEKMSIAHEVNLDNLQRRNQLVDLPLDDTKKG